MSSTYFRPATKVAGTYTAIIIFGSFFINSGSFNIIHANAAGAAQISISPATGSYAPGKTFVATVMLNSGGGVGVNAADGHLSFDPTLLAVQSISKGNSVFNLWTSNPAFSNTAGTIDYSGGSNDAYTGSAGDVMEITFKAVAAGSAEVKFISATALAADGQGTDVFGGSTGATYTIGGSAAPSTPRPAPAPAPSPSQSSGASGSGSGGGGSAFTTAIAVTSPTHPIQTQWYSNNTPNFTWTLTPDVAGVSVAFDQNPTTYPKKSSAGLISSKQYSNVAEGRWYFHARFEDAVGEWSDPINFQVNIDITPPLQFTVTALAGAGISGRTEVMFTATDTVSGLDSYMFNSDSYEDKKGDRFRWIAGLAQSLNSDRFGDRQATMADPKEAIEYIKKLEEKDFEKSYKKYLEVLHSQYASLSTPNGNEYDDAAKKLGWFERVENLDKEYSK